MSGNTGDVYGSGGDVDKEKDVLRDESPKCADLHAHEVGGRQTLPVSLPKRRPSGVRASDSRVPPRGIFKQPNISVPKTPCPIQQPRSASNGIVRLFGQYAVGVYVALDSNL
jgi:hypothetical protein